MIENAETFIDCNVFIVFDGVGTYIKEAIQVVEIEFEVLRNCGIEKGDCASQIFLLEQMLKSERNLDSGVGDLLLPIFFL